MVLCKLWILGLWIKTALGPLTLSIAVELKVHRGELKLTALGNKDVLGRIRVARLVQIWDRYLSYENSPEKASHVAKKRDGS